MAGDGMYYDEEIDELLSPAGKKKKHNVEKLGTGVCANRFWILVSLVLLVSAGIYFQSELSGLKAELQDDETKISSLQEIISVHELVIQRFNSSVTNTDVLDHLKELETELKSDQHGLKEELITVKNDISNQLNTTLSELNSSVKMAEEDINEEVATVKKAMDQYVRTTQDQFSMENSFMVYQLAGTFTLLSCLISMWHMTAHLRRFNQPIVQRKILAILYMSPIYAITSWFSLVFHSAEGYLAIVKDFYEAYIIYQFLSFCIAVLGKGDREAVVDLLTGHADHLSPPFRLDSCCNQNPYDNNRQLASAVLIQSQRFAMQFVFLRPLTTIAMFVLQQYDYKGPTGNPNDYRSPQVYLVALQNLSVFVAFTGLLKFYHAVDKDLAWCRPFAKFLCIKGVVFMTFWQGLAISLLAATTDVGGGDTEEWARSAQNFLICLEMLLFSIAHFYCFPTEEWEEGYRARNEKGKFGDSIALGDFFQDLKLVLKSQKKSKKKKGDDMDTVEEGDEDDDDDDDGTSMATDSSEYDEERAVKDIQDLVQSADEESVEKLGMLTEKILKESEPEEFKDDIEDEVPQDAPMGVYSGGEALSALAFETPATETTSLFGGSNGSASVTSPFGASTSTTNLRPSFFTVVSDISAKQQVEEDEQ